MTGEDAEGGAPQVVIKCNAVPREQLEIDCLVELSGCELRDSSRNSSRVVPEALVLPGVADRELSLSLQGKRKRDAPQCLGQVCEVQ